MIGEFRAKSLLILKEIEHVLREVDEIEVTQLIEMITSAKTIVTLGAGRVGMSTKSFTMRLGHMGFKAHMIGDTTVPSIGKEDLLLVASGSGETQTIFDMTLIAHLAGARIALVTGNRESRMAKLANLVVLLPAPSKNNYQTTKSVQPMTTLNEQSLLVFYDALVLLMMKSLKISEKEMKSRHSILE